jgi:outer membrane receptor protein involved in Fe transport
MKRTSSRAKNRSTPKNRGERSRALFYFQWSAFLAGGLSLSGTALAQDAPAPDVAPQSVISDAGSTDSSSGEIVVTGSQIQRSGFQSPTPLTAVSAQELQAKAVVNLSSLQADIPQFRPNQDNAYNAGPIGGSYLDLRSLGRSRTLVLLDGRRLAATSPDGGVDVSTIPAALISRVEVVTGGASAAYGSDAVAGVVNIFLDNDFDGLKAQAQYGQSEYDDNKESSFSAAWGRNFLDDRAHFMVAGEIYKNTGQDSQGTRPWGRDDYCLLTNPNFIASGANGPRQITSANCRYSLMTNGGLINAPVGSPLRGIQFGPGGIPAPFLYGDYAGGFWQQGGSGDSEAYYANIFPRLTRQVAFGRLSYDVTDSIEAWVEGMYSHQTGYYELVTNYDNGTLTIQRDNAFLPESVRQIMLDNDITNFRFGRTNLETGFEGNYKAQDTQRYAGGLKGDLGAAWSWDAFVQISRNDYRATSPLNRIQQNFFNAVDAVNDPATNQPACRINVDANPNNDDAACVPANVFGPGSISAGSQAYFMGTSVSDQSQTQDLYAFNLRGEPLSTWAGPVSVAFGGEYRRETIVGTSDPISVARGWRSINQQPLNGALNVKEAYVETVVPLATDEAWAQSLELNAAARITDYSTSGTVKTWKIGLNYTPFTDLRIRGTISRDIRAPSINELFQTGNQVIGPVFDAKYNISSQVLQLTGGNIDLAPEIAKTKTLGVVYQPEWLDGFRASIDYYTIKIDHAITSVGAATIAQNCFNGQTDYCAFVTRDPMTDVITRINATLINAQSFKTSGFDLEAVYQRPVGRGQLTFRALGAYVHDLIVTTNDIPVDSVTQVAGGQGNGVPHWRANLEASYRAEPWSLTALVRYVGGGTYNSTYVEGIDIDDNSVPSRTYLDLSASWDINDNVELYTKVNNVFNVDPPVTTNGLSMPQYATSVYYDVIGRVFIGGARLKF